MSLFVNYLLLLSSLYGLVLSRRSNTNSVESLARMAFEHGARVNEQANCLEPKPQLIYFNEPTKVYLPRATLIHRCSDLTGCCPHSTQSCQPVETKTVDLYFYTVSLRNGAKNMMQEQNIDKISFVNHTKCGCKPKSGIMSTNLTEL